LLILPLFVFSLTRFIWKTLQIQKVFVSIEEALSPLVAHNLNTEFVIINISEINLKYEQLKA
jgi:hypothetical protein